jgi:hypothetical protein
MWSDAWQQLISVIHAKSQPVVLVVTGGGASAISELLAVPGASKTILEARVPYAESALFEWLGRQPEHACDGHTALAMASVACQRGRRLLELGSQSDTPEDNTQKSQSSTKNRTGLSCTASLASDRPKKGDHRFFAALQTPYQSVCIGLVLNKGARSRREEEVLTGQVLIRMLAESLGISPLPELDLLPDEVLHVQQSVADSRLAAVWGGDAPCLWSLPDGSFAERPTQPVQGVLCGAFDPLHHGHEELRKVAERYVGGPVAYELSVTNVDKPPLDFLSIDTRRQQFLETPLVLTNAPRFVEKAAVLPGMTFVIGSDTAERLLNAKYDGGTQDALSHVLEDIRRANCRFLVAYRVVRGQPLRLSDLYIPPQFQDLFEEIPETEFRVDLSSTELRRRA